ncbi:MAG TPA: ribonuclease III [Candidatus Dormibacteraeota bacterium]|nr:ribonuclease III [Candidatus Dormibacteraeota bacterium]
MDTNLYQVFARDKLGVTFKDIDLLVTAFTHRSYLNEHKKTVRQHNERLEFLGDAVLELVVTEYLYTSFDQPEGVLTNWRSSLVRTESIGAAASRYQFEPLLRLSRGEKRGTERARAQILANAFEAVIGALYLDQGYQVARNFITEGILSTLDQILSTGSWIDPKSSLQEMVQSQEGATPLYRVISEEGPDHDKMFTVGVFVNAKLRGKGVGPSKQAGQQKAATEAMAYYQHKN